MTRTSFDLEHNPFERSFATNDSPNDSLPHSAAIQHSELPNTAKSTVSVLLNMDPALPVGSVENSDGQPGAAAQKSQFMANSPSLLSKVTKPKLTSPSKISTQEPTPVSTSNPGTPGNSQLWNSLLSATTTTNNSNNISMNNANENGEAAPRADNEFAQGPMNYNTLQMDAMQKSGLAPNNRSGLTPGGFGMFNGNNLTPGALGPMTPGLSSLLGLHHPAPTSAPGSASNPASLRTQNQFENSDTTIKVEEPVSNPVSLFPVQQSAHLQSALLTAPISTMDVAGSPTHDKSGGKKRKKNVTSAPGSNKKPRASRARTKKGLVTKSQENIAESSKAVESYVTHDGAQGDDDDDEDDANEDTDTDSKLSKSGRPMLALERNRLAASKCRRRKKVQMNKMQEELTFFSQGFHELSAQASLLRDQVITLKGIIVGHKDCGALASSVGGFDRLHQIIHLANMLTQSQPPSVALHSQISLPSQHISAVLPSTVPTTINTNVHHSYEMPAQAQRLAQFAPQFPLPSNTPSNAGMQLQFYLDRSSAAPNSHFVAMHNFQPQPATQHQHQHQHQQLHQHILPHDPNYPPPPPQTQPHRPHQQLSQPQLHSIDQMHSQQLGQTSTSRMSPHNADMQLRASSELGVALNFNSRLPPQDQRPEHIPNSEVVPNMGSTDNPANALGGSLRTHTSAHEDQGHPDMTASVEYGGQRSIVSSANDNQYLRGNHSMTNLAASKAHDASDAGNMKAVHSMVDILMLNR